MEAEMEDTGLADPAVGILLRGRPARGFQVP